MSTYQDYRERQYRDRAKIERVFRGKEDHDIETVAIYMVGESWAQMFGGLAFDSQAQSARFLDSFCRAMGVSDPERLVGMECEVLREFPYNNEPIAGLRSLATGRTFSIEAWRKKERPELDDGSSLDQRYAEIHRRIGYLRRQIDDLITDATRLKDDYRPVRGEAP